MDNMTCKHKNFQPDGEIEDTIVPRLVVLLGRLFSSSGRLRQQALHERGFLLVAQALEKSSSVHLTSDLLQELIRLVEKLHLLPSNHGPALLRQLADYILFNPALWCRAPPKVQIELQKFLATEFISSKLIQNSLRRVSTTLIFLHALKYYYWLVDPSDRSNIQVLNQYDLDFNPSLLSDFDPKFDPNFHSKFDPNFDSKFDPNFDANFNPNFDSKFDLSSIP